MTAMNNTSCFIIWNKKIPSQQTDTATLSCHSSKCARKLSFSRRSADVYGKTYAYTCSKTYANTYSRMYAYINSRTKAYSRSYVYVYTVIL